MSKLEKLLRKYLPKTVASIERNSLDIYFYEATKPAKYKMIRIYESDLYRYRITVQRDKSE